jgi:mediator of RNA polymerase II transcription subunit 14
MEAHGAVSRMDYGMHTDRPAENGRATFLNGVKDERTATIKQEGTPGTTGDHGPSLDGLPDAKLDELPDEIQHITAEIMPLGLLLSRLAQFSHGRLQELVLSLASKPLPEPTANGSANGNAAGGVNGNLKGMANGPGQLVEDTSPESLDKKTMLLNAIKDLHSRWVKALVITEWSRNAEDVGKLIDLRQHLAIELERYTKLFWDMVKLKDEMVYAKVPSPDLKTALEVLSGSSAHWMPDFGYLPDPPIEPEEKLKWLNEIDVTLHMRLQLHEYEHLPAPWRKYEIKNGRVTFTVPGEFEVDLTIFVEEFDNSQFWFLDFRPIFHPEPPELSERARAFVEAQANTRLRDEGLAGCYNFLHELTLTTKIAEFERQANLLNQSGLWINTLKVERLNRCLSIQYWAQSAGPPSWIILGVQSGKPGEGPQDPGTPSRLTVQWFRDSKRVDDVDIPFDADNISAEKLLMTVVFKHIDYLLSSIYAKLAARPRYAQREGRLALHISAGNPLDCRLTMRLLGQEDAILRVSPWTGNFNFLNPPPALVRDWRQRLNSLRNRVDDTPIALERFRCFYVADRLKTRAEESGWEFLPTPPLPLDEIKNLIFRRFPASRESFHAVWLRNSSWDPSWFTVLSMSLGGDHWWLVEV